MRKLAIVLVPLLILALVVGAVGCGGKAKDSDGDGWTDGQEEKAGTDPYRADTDGDGYWDSQDPNPLDANIPVATTTPTPTPTSAISVIKVIGLANSAGFFRENEEAYTIAVDPVTNRIYVNQAGTPSVRVIDGRTNSVLPTITVPDKAASLDLDPAGQELYVSTYHYWGTDYRWADLAIIDLRTNNLVANVATGTPALSGAYFPIGTAFNPTSRSVYQLDTADDLVKVVQGTEVIASLRVGVDPRAVVVDPRMNKVYVANYGSNSVSVIDGETMVVTTTIAVGAGPTRLAVNPYTGLLFVVNSDDYTVHVINCATDSVVYMIEFNAHPTGAAINPSTNHLFVSLGEEDEVILVHGLNYQHVTTISVGSYPTAIGVNFVSNRVYVVNQDGNTADRSISVIQDVP